MLPQQHTATAGPRCGLHISCSPVFCSSLLHASTCVSLMLSCQKRKLTCLTAAVCDGMQSPEASKSSAATFRQQGLPACSTLEAGFTAGQLLRGGFSPAELVQSGAPLAKLRAAGIRCVLDALAS